MDKKFFKKINKKEKNYYYVLKQNKFEVMKSIEKLQKNIEEIKLLKKLSETYKIRRRRNILAVIFLSSFILCFNISLFIITKVILLDPTYAIISALFGVLFLAIGIYLMLDNPPIYVE